MNIRQLADLIRANPNCEFNIDNDDWWMNRVPYEDNPFDYDEQPEEASKWEEDNQLCNAGDIDYYDNGYGSGPNYGGDVLQALALLAGVKVQSV